MPFASKAQAKMMFARAPEKAKEWAKETPNMKDLPEKLHPSVNPKGHKIRTKIASDGMFFQKRAQSAKGNFFRDLPGRLDATFHEKNALESMGDPTDAGATDAPMGGMASGGEDAGGGMYGTGKPKKTGVERMKTVLGKGPAKTAMSAPSDWEDGVGIPTGFHRPTIEQPKALEPGAERFFSTEARPPDYGAANEQNHGLVEGGKMHLPGSAGSQMGKHAAPRFLGTAFAKNAMNYTPTEDYLRQRGSEAEGSLRRGVGEAGEMLDRGVKGVTQSPLAMVLAAGLGAKALGHGAGAVGRGMKRMVGIKKAVPPSIIERAVGGFRRLVTHH